VVASAIDPRKVIENAEADVTLHNFNISGKII
jgi:hypothetical protein